MIESKSLFITDVDLLFCAEDVDEDDRAIIAWLREVTREPWNHLQSGPRLYAWFSCSDDAMMFVLRTGARQC